MGICLRYARKRSDAEDMLQEGFIEVFRKIKSYSFKGSFDGWVKKVVFNQVINYIRKHYKLNEVYGGLDDLNLVGKPVDRLGEEELLSIINSIPEKYKIVFNMYAVDRYSHKEIGEKLSIKESTVRSLFFRARNMIKEKLNNIQNIENKTLNYGS